MAERKVPFITIEFVPLVDMEDSEAEMMQSAQEAVDVLYDIMYHSDLELARTFDIEMLTPEQIRIRSLGSIDLCQDDPEFCEEEQSES